MDSSQSTDSPSVTLEREVFVNTKSGTILVFVKGDSNKPAIFTFHDLGLNHKTNFSKFFSSVDMRILMERFCVYHLNAPGQENSAKALPEGYFYPSMDQLASSIGEILKHFGVNHFVGFGVGAGANILARFALTNPYQVSGLFLINCTAAAPSWLEWAYQKLNALYLRNAGMNDSALDYLSWHHFGKAIEPHTYPLIEDYRASIKNKMNPYNLSLFIDSYLKRTDLKIIRETNKCKKRLVKNFRCSVLLMVGSNSSHLEETLNMVSRMDPEISSWIKLSECGMVLEEKPAKVSEAFRLFLQGLGYIPSFSWAKLDSLRKKSSEFIGLNHMEGNDLICDAM